MNRVCVEICLWLGKELAPDFTPTSRMCTVREEPVRPGARIGELMSGLAGRYPLLQERVFDPERTRFNPLVVINYNDRVINPRAVHGQVLGDGDKVTVLPVYSGG